MQITWALVVLGVFLVSYEAVECFIQAARIPILVRDTKMHAHHCQASHPKATCKEFVECAKRFPSVDECSKLGGMLVVPTCNYFTTAMFNTSIHGVFNCVRKFITVDYKDLCKSEEEMKNCEAFVSCCSYTAHNNCTRLYSGEIERPICPMIQGDFDYNEAVCRCATASPKLSTRSDEVYARIRYNTTAAMVLIETTAPKDAGNAHYAPMGLFAVALVARFI